MALRMVLVGVVAGLGLTLPTGRQFTSWKDSAQSWASARLAAWDAQMPADENAFVLVVEPASIAADSVPRVGQKSDLPAADAPKTVVSAPTTPALTGENDPKTTPTDLAVGLETPTSPTPLTESEVVEPALSTLDSAFGIAQNEVVSAFAADEKAIVAANPPAPAPAGAPSIATPFEPLEVGDNFYEGLAYELNRGSEGLSLSHEEVARFEPLEVADDLYAGVAYALNREAEGLDLPAQPEPPRPTVVRLEDMRPATTDSRLTHAVRLTRDAVYAWANLLHGPAVVTIAH
jgi:hypothetical protein